MWARTYGTDSPKNHSCLSVLRQFNIIITYAMFGSKFHHMYSGTLEWLLSAYGYAYWEFLPRQNSPAGWRGTLFIWCHHGCHSGWHSELRRWAHKCMRSWERYAMHELLNACKLLLESRVLFGLFLKLCPAKLQVIVCVFAVMLKKARSLALIMKRKDQNREKTMKTKNPHIAFVQMLLIVCCFFN